MLMTHIRSHLKGFDLLPGNQACAKMGSKFPDSDNKHALVTNLQNIGSSNITTALWLNINKD